MAKKTKRTVRDVVDYVENEGFDYCFTSYSSFDDVEDEKFHELRKAYIKAHDVLESYLDKFRDEEDM